MTKNNRKHFQKKNKENSYKQSQKRFSKKADIKKSFNAKENKNAVKSEENALIRLNKYIANSGICSRREADDLIKAGVVKVNGEIVTTLGYKIRATDVVEIEGQKIKNERKVYVLLNKPKDYLTTTKDPQNRKTVMELVKDACKERIFPVGRLDRQTTGLLLLTNDGELADKLMHPKSNIPKLYHVTLNKNFSLADFEKLSNGIELEDGFIKPDSLSYVLSSKKDLGIEIHSGRNRIVRRIFENLGYEGVKLDRAVYAGLTKKNLPRGKWRFLTPQEINYLKML